MSIFLALHCNIADNLTESKALAYPTEDTMLTTKLLKVLGMTTVKLLSLEHKTSGFKIYNMLMTVIETPKTTKEVKTLYVKFVQIGRSPSESIKAYAMWVQLAAGDLQGTLHTLIEA
eukprot:2958205-Ditylum_brightwellii.AAC.1